jgi:hypothetical protein
VNDAVRPNRVSSQHGRWLYWGTSLWLIAGFTVGWLPLLWFNDWTPPNVWSSVLLITFSVVLTIATVSWWFLVGWCFALTARMRRNAVVLGAMVGGIGIVLESSVQLTEPFGATGGGDPGIGDVLVAPLVPAIVAVPILMVMGAGFYIHAIRDSRQQTR